jgi:hypothetical protein
MMSCKNKQIIAIPKLKSLCVVQYEHLKRAFNTGDEK